MEEYKIGEVFLFGKKKLKCVEGLKCQDCAMNDLEIGACEFISRYVGACAARDREDHTGVIFIEVEEDGRI